MSRPDKVETLLKLITCKVWFFIKKHEKNALRFGDKEFSILIC